MRRPPALAPRRCSKQVEQYTGLSAVAWNCTLAIQPQRVQTASDLLRGAGGALHALEEPSCSLQGVTERSLCSIFLRSQRGRLARRRPLKLHASISLRIVGKR